MRLHLDAHGSSLGAAHWSHRCGWTDHPSRALGWHTHEVSVKELDELLVHEPVLGTCVTSVLFEYRCQVPPLQLAQAPNHCACPVSAKIAHDEQRVSGRLQEQTKPFEDGLLGDGLPRIALPSNILAEVDQVDLLVFDPCEQRARQLVGCQVDYGAQVQLLKEWEVEIVGLSGAKQVVFDHPKILRRDQRAHEGDLFA